MTRIFQLIGDTTVDLLSITGIIPQSNLDGIKLTAAQVFDDQREVPETIRLNLLGTSTDDAAAKIQAFWALLNQVKEYREGERPTAPVYLKQQLTGESNPRYARVKDVPMFDWPAMLRNPLELDHIVENFGITVIRDHPWRDIVPGTYPSAYLALTATDGPTGRLDGFVTDSQENNAITHIYMYDASVPAYSIDRVNTDVSSLFVVTGSTPALNDAVMFCFANVPPSNVVLNIATPGVYVGTMAVEYSKVGGWGALTLGTNLVILTPGAFNEGLTNLFQGVADTVLSFLPPSDWSGTETYNSQTGFWLRIRISAFTSWTTSPVTDKKFFTQLKPYIEIPSTSISGDGGPLLCMDLFPGYGSSASPALGNISRILVGARSETSPARLAGFFSHLPLGNGWNADDFARTYGADTTSAFDVTAPGSYLAACTFAGDATLKPRAILTGTLKLKYYTGKFKVFLECQQINGAAGDCNVRASVMIGGSTAGNPIAYIPSATSIALKSFNAGYEIVDLTGDGYINIPFDPTAKGDVLDADLIISVWASRSSGAATLNLSQIILLPIDEYGQDLQDPKTDAVSGSSALRGGTMLENDAGIILNRCAKKLILAGGSISAEEWRRGGDVYHLRPNRQYRFYFVILRCPTTWYVPPLVGGKGLMLGVKVYAVQGFNTIRGNITEAASH